MKSKRLIYVAGAILLVSALLVGTAALADPEAAYYWSSPTTSYVAQFDNTGNGYGTRAYTSGANVISQYGSAYGSNSTGFRGYSGVNGYGVYGRDGSSGVGVYGESTSTAAGYGGYFYGYWGLAAFGKGNGIGVYADSGSTGTYAVYAYGGTYGVYGRGTGYGGYFGGELAGVVGQANASGGAGVYGYSAYSNSPAVKAYATSTEAVYAETTALGQFSGNFLGQNASGSGGIWGNGQPNNNLDLRADNCALIAGVLYGCTKEGGGASYLARNDGSETLQPGDVVVFKGYEPDSGGGPLVSVAKAGPAGGVILGIVRGQYVVNDPPAAPAAPAKAQPAPASVSNTPLVQPPVPEGEVPLPEDASAPVTLPLPAEAPPNPTSPAPPDGVDQGVGSFVEASVDPGQRMLVTFQGIVSVSLTATKAIAAGDWIVVTPAGKVTAVAAQQYSRALDRGYSILGRALEPLASGTGLVLIRLDLR